MSGEISREQLERAVKVLNERKHRDFDGWSAGKHFACGPNCEENLMAFEAVATAEKYEGEDAARRIISAIEAERDQRRAKSDEYHSRGELGPAMVESLAATEAAACLDIARKAAGITERGQP